jgi:glycosyltransferase involved in cell wall biosynthesis
MRLLHIIAGGRHGGAERFFVDLAGALARRGVDQHAITRPYPDRLAHLSEFACETTPARMGGILDLVSRRKTKRTAKQFGPDLVLAWMNRAAKLMPQGPWVTVGRLGGYYNLKYYRACDHLICNTPDLVKHCVGQGWPEKRVDYIPNFSPTIEVAPVLRSSLATPNNVPVLLVLARLEDSKAVDVAIKALAELSNAFLWVAGEGSRDSHLKALANTLGVSGRVRFLGWREDREALLKAADVCLVPSRHEPFGNVVVNAWANGIPLIAAASEGPRFLISPDENGILIPVDDPAAMAAAVLRILGDKTLAQRLVENGRARIADTFSEESVASSYAHLFERLIAESQ